VGPAALPGGLYAITDSRLVPADQLLEQVAAAIRGGARVIQYRDKSAPAEQRWQQAAALLGCCRAQGVPLIINDDIALASAIDADGVHLGEQDDTVQQARAQLGEAAIIGVSCYNRIERATTAASAGADYVAFGRFFASNSKPDAVSAEPELLQQARALMSLPIVAIGGITPDNGASLIAAGADNLAAIHGVFGQADVTTAARNYAALFTL